MSKHDDAIEFRPSEVKNMIKAMAPTGRSTFIWGPPGIAKSSVIAALAKEMGYGFVDIRLSQMDPTDLRGIPYPAAIEVMDPESGKMITETVMRWSPPESLPRDPNAKVFILLDEFNAAPPSVQAGAYQLVLDRKLGEYNVPKNCVIIAAGNRETDKGITYRMPTPIANRFVHINMRSDFEDWQAWALDANVDPAVVGFLTTFKDKLFSFDPASATRGFATPRSWHFVSDIVKHGNGLTEAELGGLVYGAIGAEGPAFMVYRKKAIELPDTSKILSGEIKELKNVDVSLCYALTTSLCYQLKTEYDLFKGLLKDNRAEYDKKEKEWAPKADAFLGFMMKNFQTEVVVMGAKTALAVFKLPLSARLMPNFKAFSDEYREYILG